MRDVNRPLAAAGIALFALSAYALISGANSATIGLAVLGVALLLVSYLGPRLIGTQRIGPTGIQLNVAEQHPAQPLDEEPTVAMTPGTETPSFDQAIVSMLSNPAHVDYVRVDLSNGYQWLTSRLFLLAALVERARGATSIIFLEQQEGAERRYVGIADIRAVRWAMAREEPQLEAAFDFTQGNEFHPWWLGSIPEPNNIWQHPEPEGAVKVGAPPEGVPRVATLTGALDDMHLVNIYYATLNVLRIDPAPAGDPPVGWVRLSRPAMTSYWECATWINGTRLRLLLGSQLEERALVESKTGAISGTEVVLWNGSVVPVTDQSRGFIKALDRTVTAREIATRPHAH